MKHVATALVAGSLALAAFGAGSAAAATFQPYTNPGEWFSPGEGYGSAYDHFCGPWVQNNFSKAEGAWGLITLIDTSGRWNYTDQGGGWLRRMMPSSTSRTWSKKLHCKNNSGVTYQGGCWGMREIYSNCV